MNLITKLLSSAVTMIFTIIGMIVTGWVFLTNTMDVKDAQAVGGLRSEIREMRIARDEQIKGMSDTVNARLDGQQDQLDNIQANVRIILKRSMK